MFHPDTDTLRLFAACRLDEGQEEEIERHLADCPDCRRCLAEFENKEPGSVLHEMRVAMQKPSSASEAPDVQPRSDTGGFASGDCIDGKYRLETPLGRGGMGVAWKAWETTANRYVVLKFVPKEIQHVAEAMNAVRESFDQVHALQHQHICPVYDLADDPDAGLYLVMKFVDGLTLGEYRRRYAEENEPMSFDHIVQILRAMAEALDYAHERKVIHRDIKPQNVMISATDNVQIIDFGLADEIRSTMERITGPVLAKISGTRPYMAPEQWQGQSQDARTDQYALAVTAYELFAGRVPFQNSDSEVLRNCVINELPKPIANLPEHVNTALLKALSKKREDRFETCIEFVEALVSKTPLAKHVRNILLLAFLATAICGFAFFFLDRSSTSKPLLPDQSVSSATGDTREQGLSFVFDQLTNLGWNVEKAPSRTSEYDFELYGKDVNKRIRLKVKTVRGNNNFAFGNNLGRMKSDFWILVKILDGREKEPIVFIMRPEEVEKLIHIYGGNNGGKPSYWLRPESYEKDEYRNRWKLLGSPNR